MVKYISNKKVNPKSSNDLNDFDGISDAVWNFLSSVYQFSWDSLYTDNHSKSLREKIPAKLTPRVVPSLSRKTIKNPNLVTINKALPPPPLPAKTKKEVNIISKYFLPNKPLVNNNVNGNSNNSGKSYAQATKTSNNTLEVLKIKETLPSLNAQKVDQVNNIVNSQAKPKPRIKMTIKGPFRKQVIIPISGENTNSFMKSSSLHVANMNRLLHNAKSDVLTDYICANNIGITIITNKISQQSDIVIINNYVKSLNNINSLQVDKPCLPKSKSYLKIIGILLFLHANSQERLTLYDIKMILKQNHIFDNISLTSKPRVIKVSPKSDISIVWLDIWDVQSSSNAKMLINKCFNVGNYIMTIRGANMNSGVSQCKNCWKWGHATFLCRIQGAKYVKCNGLHKSEHHREFGWCCKANDKINPPRLETKSVRTVVETTLPTPINVRFGTTGSTGSGTRENMLRSVRIDLNHFVLKRMTLLINDCGKSQGLFVKCLQELSISQHPSRNLNPF